MKAKKIGILAAGVFLGLGALAPNASAGEMGTQSADCNTWSKGNTGYAYCSGLGVVGAHQVKIVCTDIRGVETTFYGPWVGNAKTSSRACPGSGFLRRVGSVIQD
ncbi:hypothetical protein [Streptomyces sp. NRRL F-5650]|uniref:hypothetical protein n=1 Tax=Streptomyces sp. NRRL F-5650 TaxID=1463868 RepID=UPI0004C6AA9C|nr:hypothetical protein [Streptomyces sp. NRRL F-5650]